MERHSDRPAALERGERAFGFEAMPDLLHTKDIPGARLRRAAGALDRLEIGGQRRAGGSQTRGAQADRQDQGGQWGKRLQETSSISSETGAIFPEPEARFNGLKSRPPRSGARPGSPRRAS